MPGRAVSENARYTPGYPSTIEKMMGAPEIPGAFLVGDEDFQQISGSIKNNIKIMFESAMSAVMFNHPRIQTL